MRDPQRISTVLKEIERLWQLHPDWRIGQLISNVAAWRGESVWDMEEAELVDEIQRHLKQAEQTSESQT